MYSLSRATLFLITLAAISLPLVSSHEPSMDYSLEIQKRDVGYESHDVPVFTTVGEPLFHPPPSGPPRELDRWLDKSISHIQSKLDYPSFRVSYGPSIKSAKQPIPIRSTLSNEDLPPTVVPVEWARSKGEHSIRVIARILPKPPRDVFRSNSKKPNRYISKENFLSELLAHLTAYRHAPEAVTKPLAAFLTHPNEWIFLLEQCNFSLERANEYELIPYGPSHSSSVLSRSESHLRHLFKPIITALTKINNNGITHGSLSWKHLLCVKGESTNCDSLKIINFGSALRFRTNSREPLRFKTDGLERVLSRPISSTMLNVLPEGYVKAMENKDPSVTKYIPTLDVHCIFSILYDFIVLTGEPKVHPVYKTLDRTPDDEHLKALGISAPLRKLFSRVLNRKTWSESPISFTKLEPLLNDWYDAHLKKPERFGEWKGSRDTE